MLVVDGLIKIEKTELNIFQRRFVIYYVLRVLLFLGSNGVQIHFLKEIGVQLLSLEFFCR